MPNWQENNQVKWVGVKPARQGTQIVARGVANNGLVNLYTVPAGRIFYLCESTLSSDTNVAGTYYAYIRTGGLVVWRYLGIVLRIAGQFAPPHTILFWPPLEVPAGYSIDVVSGVAGLNGYLDIFGWVE